MSNITFWTEDEVNILVQVWSEVEAKYPSLRCQEGAGALHEKIYSLFTRKNSFPRSSCAVLHAKNQIRNFLLYVRHFDEERRQDGGLLWFELTTDQREQRRRLVPHRLRNLTTALSKEAYVKLLKMERVQRWFGGRTSRQEADEIQMDSSFIAPISSEIAGTPPTLLIEDLSEQEEEKKEVQLPGQSSNSSTCSLISSLNEEEMSFSPSTRVSVKTLVETTKSSSSSEIRANFKYRDCSLLVEKMMKLQNKRERKAVTKLRASIESELERSSEMLRSIIKNQFKDPDIALLTKVLNMQEQHIRDRFDQFMEKRTRDEAENRALLGQRYHEKF